MGARKEKTRHEQIDRQEAKQDKARHEQIDRQEAKKDDALSKEQREKLREEVRRMMSKNKELETHGKHAERQGRERRNGDHEVERPRNALTNSLDTQVDHARQRPRRREE